LFLQRAPETKTKTRNKTKTKTKTKETTQSNLICRQAVFCLMIVDFVYKVFVGSFFGVVEGLVCCMNMEWGWVVGVHHIGGY